MFVCRVSLVIYDLHHPKVPLHYTFLQRYTKAGRERNTGRQPRLSQTDPGKLAALCLLSGDVRSRLPLPYCHHRHCHPDGARGGAKPLEENLLLREAEAEETALASLQSLRPFEKGCSVHGSQPHYISVIFCKFLIFVGSFALFLLFVFFCQFPQIDLSLSSIRWLTGIFRLFIWLDHWAGAQKEKGIFSHSLPIQWGVGFFVFFCYILQANKICYNQAMCSIMVLL